MVGREVKRSDLGEKLPAGVVLTGGAAETLGVAKVAQKVLGLPQRVGHPRGVTGLIDELGGAAQAAAVGLVLYGAYFAPEAGIARLVSREKLGGVFSRVVQWAKSFVP